MERNELPSADAAPLLGATTGRAPDVTDAAALAPIVDPFDPKPEDFDRAVKECMCLAVKVAALDGTEVREALANASRTKQGKSFVNPASASIDWVCATINVLKARLGMSPRRDGNAMDARISQQQRAADELIARALELERQKEQRQ